jgi:protein-disulfide isomerase
MGKFAPNHICIEGVIMKEEKKNKRQERRERARQKEQVGRTRTLIFITVGAVLLVLAFIWPSLKPITNIVPVDIDPKPNADRNSMGDPNAPIHIEEYSDFQCPFCKRFFVDTEPLLEEYFVKTGKVYFTYHSAGNWVSGNLGGVRTESADAAAAAYCAADQGKFWEMHAALFTNSRDVEDQGSFTDRRLKAIAETVGLDMSAFNACYNDGTYKDQVQQDLQTAQDAGIQGTPFFVMTYKVNGEVKTETIDGAQPINVFQQKIEDALRVADQ